ncbi:MAG: hypothetical protein EA363_00680 [Balneolaceae bacterium]|nr:MAG: hypothetical protein EA363_00680 [Balneolaceae bacterium]
MHGQLLINFLLMVQRITNHSNKPVHPGSSLFIPILLILPAWILVSCYTTLDRQSFRFAETESVTDSRAYRGDAPDLPVPYSLLASIPKNRNTLVLEGGLSNFYSLRDFAVDQGHRVCLYDPFDGVLGIHKQVPETRLELIVFYRISGRFIETNAFWRLVGGHLRPHSAVESERAPTMWASADLTGRADRPVRRSDNPDSSEVNRGRVAEPRSTGNVERRPGQDESAGRRDGEDRQTSDRRTNDDQSRENRRGEAPSVPVNPQPSHIIIEEVRSSGPPRMPTVTTTPSQPWQPAILEVDVFSDRSVAFAHVLDFILQSPYDGDIRYQYIRLEPELPDNHPCSSPNSRGW